MSTSAHTPLPGSAPIAVGSLLGGRYRLTAYLGAGGMATIFRGVDESLGRTVAVKVLHAHLVHDASLLERFRTEARHAASLLHPNIVNVFDQGVADLPYIVMECVDGPSLREVLLRRGRLTPREALAVVEPVARALARAHGAGVVHRDVKPENVLIAADGTPKVADFGIARALAETSHTAKGSLIGSVHYLAPEMVDGHEAGPRSDQYSLGVVLFELLTGRKPLPGDSPMAVALRHAKEPLPPASRFEPDVSPALDAVIGRATALDPERRFPDLGAFVAALHHAVPDGPVPVVVDDGSDGTLVIPAEAVDTVRVPRPVTRRPVRRRDRRAPLLVGVLLIVALVGFGLWSFVIAPPTDVPQLTGLDRNAARAAAAEAGLDLVVADTRTDPRAPAGTIATQDPVAGASLRRGGDVVVVVSDGPATITVPRVVGEEAADAERLLTSDPYYLEVDVELAYSDRVPKDRVIRQDPRPGVEALQGRGVTIVVSRGIEQVEVPAVEGKTLDQAREALAEAKLEVEVKERYSDEFPTAGTVIRQNVDAGKTVDKGTTVTLRVSKGPVTIAMPNVNGHEINAAVAELQAVGLHVQVIERGRPRFGPFRQGTFGRVEVQDPATGTPVRRGQTVDLYTYSQAAEQRGE